jgi:hypothetical protein
MSIVLVTSALFSGTNKMTSAAGQNVTFTLQSSSTETPQNMPITLTGTMSAPVSGIVTLQWGINSSGFVANYDLNMTNGSAGRSFGFAGPGNWTFRIYWPGNENYSTAMSNVINVNVLPAQFDEETDFTIYIVAAVAVVLVVALGLFFYLKKRKTKEPTDLSGK